MAKKEPLYSYTFGKACIKVYAHPIESWEAQSYFYEVVISFKDVTISTCSSNKKGIFRVTEHAKKQIRINNGMPSL